MLTSTTRETTAPTATRLWEQFWRDPRIGLLLTVGLAVLAGVFIARVMPHGPATATQALIVMAAGLMVGLFAGWVM